MTASGTTGDTYPLRDAARPRSRQPTRVVEKSAWFASVLCSGLFAGFLIGVLILEFSLRNFDASVYTQVRLVELDHLDDLASVLLPAAIISSVLLLFVTITKREPSRWLALTAAITLAAVFAISLAVNVPINTEQHSWNVLAPPSDWVSVRDRWQTAHLARAILALFSFVVLTAIPVARHTPGKPLVG
jgi:hypothetical protein